MNSDELTALSQTHNVISNPPPPPTGRGRGRGRGDDRKKIVYKLTRPPIKLLYCQPLHRPGEPTLGGGGPRRGRPEARGRWQRYCI